MYYCFINYYIVDQVTIGILLILRHHRTGLIPTEIGQLINLTELYLYENQLTGRWPKHEMVDQSTTGILIYQTDHQLRLCINDLLE